MEDTSDIGIEHLIGNAARNRENLALAIADGRITRIFDRASGWARTKFNQDAAEVRQVLLEKFCANVDKIRNPRCLDLWCYRVVKHYCIDEIKRQRREIGYSDDVICGDSQGKKRGGRALVQTSLVLTPEQVHSLKAALRRATEPFPKQFVDSWAIGNTAKQIADEMGISVPTTYRILSKMQMSIAKAIIEELGITPDGTEYDFKVISEIAREQVLQYRLPTLDTRLTR